MPHALKRILQFVSALLLAAALKWLFDRVLWDFIFGLFDRMTDFVRAEFITAVLSYLVPLALAALAFWMLFERYAEEDTMPVLRKHPWQSRRLIAAVLIAGVALMAGTSYGRVFGLPSVTLPASGAFGP
jgi:hypothetical protein